MKIVIIGGTGLIGTRLVNKLRQSRQDVVAASPNSGVNTITGEGLAGALAGAEAVVDVANSPSLEGQPALEFFETSGRNLLAPEAAALGHESFKTTAESYAKREAVAGAQQKRALAVLTGGKLAS